MEERENAEDHGVPDMTMMPEITEQAINDNLKKRYIHDLVYVSFSITYIDLVKILAATYPIRTKF